MNFESINTEDVITIKTFIKHFNLPVSEPLTEALNKVTKDDSLENKEALGKAFIKYMASNPLSNIDPLFEECDKEIAKENEKLNEEK